MRKSANPAFAILAAYVCQRIGELDQIEDMEYFDIGMGPYTPFDFLLLTGRERAASGRTLVGEYPLLSTGWSLLSLAEVSLDPRIAVVAVGVKPSLWTMLNAEAGALLASVIADLDEPLLMR